MRGETLLVAKARADRGTIHNVPVLMLVAAVVILAGVVVVASGRGGEIAPEHPDYPPIDLGPVTAADVALLRPPSAAWGYNMRVTDEALETIAHAVTERDIKIAELQQQLDDLRGEPPQQRERPSGAWPAVADAGNEGAEGAEGSRGSRGVRGSRRVPRKPRGPRAPRAPVRPNRNGPLRTAVPCWPIRRRHARKRSPPAPVRLRGDRPAARQPGHHQRDGPACDQGACLGAGLERGQPRRSAPQHRRADQSRPAPAVPGLGRRQGQQREAGPRQGCPTKAGRRRLAPARRGLPAARPTGPGPLGPKSPRPGMGRMMPGQSPSSGMTRIRRWSGARSTSAPRPAVCRSRTRPPSPAGVNPRPARPRRSRVRPQRGRASASRGPARPRRSRVRPQRGRASVSPGPARPRRSRVRPQRGRASVSPGPARPRRSRVRPQRGRASVSPGPARPRRSRAEYAADSDDERSLAHSEQDRD